MKYTNGTKIQCNGFVGIIIPNFKLPSDICVEWETGLKASYDEEWLDENAIIMDK